MNKIWIIARHEFLITVRRLSYVLLTISFPLLSLLIIGGYSAYSLVDDEVPSAEDIKVGYVDDAGLIGNYTEAEGILFITYNTSEEAKTALLEGDISEYYFIPQDYIDRGAVSRFTLKREIEPPGDIIAQVEKILIYNLLSTEVDVETILRVQDPMETVSLRLDPETGQVMPSENPLAFILPFIFALLFLVSLLLASGFLIQSVSEEKENRLIEILLSSVSAKQLLTGKVIGLGAAGLLQIVVWFLAAIILAALGSAYIDPLQGLTIPPALIVFGIIYFILGYLFYGILLAAIGSMGATVRESNQLTTIIVLPAIIPLMLISLFVTNPDHVVFTVLTLFPVTAPITAIMKLSIGALPVWELLLSMALLCGSIVASMWLAARAFRTFLLMYGKRPSFAEVWRYLREG
jgi:ABC-2 type transport system permease protein